jgi:hypothetical protein
MEGAQIAASTHALAKALLFTCLSAPEAAESYTIARKGTVKPAAGPTAAPAVAPAATTSGGTQ